MSGGPLELRALVAVVAASLAFTALAASVYRRDAGRRRAWFVVLAPLLALAPWWPALGALRWQLGLHGPIPAFLAQPLPWLAAVLWWSIAAVLLLRLGIVVGRERRRLNALPDHPDRTLHDQCRRLAQEVGLRGPVFVRVGPMPCASSLAGQTVVLPATICNWSRDARAAVLTHEITHLARRDDRQMLLMRCLIDWYWWMPWLRGLYRRYVEAMEESCDDRASRLMPGRCRYVGGLVEAARRLTRADTAAGHADVRWQSSPALLGRSHLGVRAARLLERPRPTLRCGDGRGWLALVLLPFVLAITVQPVAAPSAWPADAHPVRFASDDAGAASAETGSRPRITTLTFARLSPHGAWQAVPPSARRPAPVFPIDALARGVGGTITVEQRLDWSPAGLRPASAPRIVSREGARPLADAVQRALDRPPPERAALLHPATAGYRFGLAALRPGAQLELRTLYRFDPGSGPISHATKGVPP